MKKAKYITYQLVFDPDTQMEVEISVYKHENGGMFAMDSSWLDQCTDPDNYPVIRDPFDEKGKVMLID